MLLEGVQLGRYQLQHLLGSGGMGEVYIGEDTHIRRQVAIKVIRAESAPNHNSETARESARLFQREVRAIAMLDHPPHPTPIRLWRRKHEGNDPHIYGYALSCRGR